MLRTKIVIALLLLGATATAFAPTTVAHTCDDDPSSGGVSYDLYHGNGTSPNPHVCHDPGTSCSQDHVLEACPP